MQFRKTGKRIDVLVYRGYDKEKKRSKIERVGSIDAETLIVKNDKLYDNLEPEELTELEQFLANEQDLRRKQESISCAKNLHSMLCKTADSITRNEFTVSNKWCSAVYHNFDLLQKQMRAHGFTRKDVKSKGGSDE